MGVATPYTTEGRATFLARWPAFAVAWSVGLFCVAVGGMWAVDHVLRGEAVDETGWVIFGSLVLRVLTIGIALSSVMAWGSHLPTNLVLTGLWGCAAAQLTYPAAELVAKVAVLAGLVDLPSRGVGNMTATGWFNFAAVWLVFGVPGLLFILAAHSWRNRRGGSLRWPLIGIGAGTVALFAIGMLIG